MTRAHVLHVPGWSETRDANVRALGEVMDVCVHEDRARRGVLWNYTTALRCIERESAPWGLVVQDDADPVPGWDQHLPHVLKHAPAAMVSLFHLGNYGRRLIDAKGVPYGVGKNAMWGVAGAYRRDVVPPLVEIAEFVERRRLPGREDDAIPTVYNVVHGTVTAMTTRSLFRHLPDRSILGHGGARRHGSSTVEDIGPWWGATPRYASVGTSWRRPNVMNAVREWQAECDTIVTTDVFKERA